MVQTAFPRLSLGQGFCLRQRVLYLGWQAAKLVVVRQVAHQIVAAIAIALAGIAGDPFQATAAQAGKECGAVALRCLVLATGNDAELGAAAFRARRATYVAVLALLLFLLLILLLFGVRFMIEARDCPCHDAGK